MMLGLLALLCISVPPPLRKSQTRLVKLFGLSSFRLLFSGTFLEPELSNDVFPPELLESNVSYSFKIDKIEFSILISINLISKIFLKDQKMSTWWARLVRLLYLRLKKEGWAAP